MAEVGNCSPALGIHGGASKETVRYTHVAMAPRTAYPFPLVFPVDAILQYWFAP